jgi:hypothetical protein
MVRAYGRRAGSEHVDRVVTDLVDTDALDSRQGYQDVTSSRSLDTWYQNTTGADLNVSFWVQADSGSTTMAPRLSVNSSQSDLYVAREQDTVDSGDRFTLTATVPDQYYYRAVSFGDTSSYSLDKWVEQQ